jgi:hypothetical protein
MRISGAALMTLLAASLCHAQTPCVLPDPVKQAAVRFVVIGDFGDHDSDGHLVPESQQVLQAIASAHHKQPFDFGLTVGDNFYPRGTGSIPALQRRWQSYEGLQIRFFASLGNHDYFRGRARVQVRYDASQIIDRPAVKTWNMPCRYYTFTAGPVRLVALDTDEGTLGIARRVWRLLTLRFGEDAWSTHQAQWLERQLASSASPWTIVYGHHPLLSRGPHGDTGRLQGLHPMLARHKVTAYIAGHDHSLQWQHVSGIDFLVAGAGGRDTTRLSCGGDPNCEKLRAKFGFLVVEASDRRYAWEFFDERGRSLLTGGTTR